MRIGVRGLLLAVVASGCGSPTAPSSTHPYPGGLAPRATWEGSLTRGGESATISISIDEQPTTPSSTFLAGSFVAAYPTATYSGQAGAFAERGRWALTLIPSTHRQCPVPLTTASGTTILTLAGTDTRMTGDAVLVECEGRTTWAAELIRR